MHSHRGRTKLHLSPAVNTFSLPLRMLHMFVVIFEAPVCSVVKIVILLNSALAQALLTLYCHNIIKVFSWNPVKLAFWHLPCLAQVEWSPGAFNLHLGRCEQSNRTRVPTKTTRPRPGWRGGLGSVAKQAVVHFLWVISMIPPRFNLSHSTVGSIVYFFNQTSSCRQLQSVCVCLCVYALLSPLQSTEGSTLSSH